MMSLHITTSTFTDTRPNEQAPGADAIGATCLFLRHSPRGSGAALVVTLSVQGAPTMGRTFMRALGAIANSKLQIADCYARRA
jgi:hypothetical protein